MSRERVQVIKVSLGGIEVFVMSGRRGQPGGRVTLRSLLPQSRARSPRTLEMAAVHPVPPSWKDL